MSTVQRHPWVVHVLWDFLHNDELTLSLIEVNPFPDTPPLGIRVSYYKYNFEELGSENVWRREYIGEWFPAVTKDNLAQIAEQNGWD